METLIFLIILTVKSYAFDIPEEFYMPAFLTDIGEGYSPFYAQTMQWQNYVLKQLEHEEELFSSSISHKIDRPKQEMQLESNSIPFSLGLNVNCAFYHNETITHYALTDGKNYSIFCLSGENTPFQHLISELDFCTMEKRCENSASRILIVCHDTNETNALTGKFGKIGSWPQCENGGIQLIQLKSSKNDPGNTLSRFQQKKGRFYCPSEVSCIVGEILLDSILSFDWSFK